MTEPNEPEPSPSVVGQLETLPWDGILLEVRRAAYRVAWIDSRVQQLVEAENEEIRVQRTYHPTARDWSDLRKFRAEVKEWLQESRAERTHLMSACKSAISAGLSQRMLSQIQLERETLVRVLYATFDVLNLDGDQQAAAIGAMLEAVDQVAIERRGGGPDGEAVGVVRPLFGG